LYVLFCRLIRSLELHHTSTVRSFRAVVVYTERRMVDCFKAAYLKFYYTLAIKTKQLSAIVCFLSQVYWPIISSGATAAYPRLRQWTK